MHIWGVVGSLATLPQYYYKFSPDSEREKSLNIGQYSTKLQGVQKCANFLGHTVFNRSERWTQISFRVAMSEWVCRV